MRPTTAVHRQDLGMTSEEFNLAQSREGFISHLVLPVLGRRKASGEFPKIKLESLLTEYETEHADGAAYDRSDSDWEQDSYATVEHGHETTVTDRTVRKYESEIDAEYYQTQRAIDIVLRKNERDAATLLMSSGTYPGGQVTSLSGGPWSDEANADPIGDLEPKREAFVLRTGKEPNALVINARMKRHLMNCELLIDRLKYQGYQDARLGQLTTSHLQIALDIPKIIVAGAISNSASITKARALYRIWPTDRVLLCRVAETMDPGEPCLGRTITWTQESALDGDRLDVIVEEYREEVRRGTVFRARNDRQHKLLYTEMAHLFTGAAA